MLKRLITIALIAISSLPPALGQFVNAPDLNCISIVSGTTGDILLEWSLPSNSCGAFNSYEIFRSTNINGPYTLIHTETNQFATSFTDNTVNGNTTIYYYYLVSDYSCPGYSFLHSDTLDNLPPEPPVFNYVTVVNNAAVLNWAPGPSPETYGYIVYLLIPANQPLDTIYGKLNTTYTHLGATVNSGPVTYSVSAIDSCLHTGGFTAAHHTIYLEESIDRCDGSISLHWNSYDNWTNGVLKYEVFVSQNGNPPLIEQTLPPDSFTCKISGFNDGDSICVFVVATEAVTSFASTSNTICKKFNIVQPANDLYIRNVTVSAPNQVDIYYSMDALADLLSLRMERSLDGVYFTQLAQVPIPGDLSIINIFSDTTALTNQLSYYYRLVAMDSCSNADTSTVGKSILLLGYAFTNLSFLVQWDESYFDNGTVNMYSLYRDDGTGFVNLGAFDPDQFQYSESGLSTPEPCYYIEASDSLVFANGTIDTITSRSNVLCLTLPSQIYMPNAFAPEGKNNIFLPILNVNGISSYDFSIFNRWGQEIFATSDPSRGWDGTFLGNLVPQGAYVYQVLVVDGNKKHIEAKGSVLVVR